MALGSAILIALALGVRAVASRARRVSVAGESMKPTLRPGDEVLVWRPVRGLRPGDVVAYRDRFDRRLRIKRIAAVPGGQAVVDGRVIDAGDGLVVLGDNRILSTDSRAEGPIAPSDVVGVAVARLGPKGRRGPLRYDRGP